MPKFFVTAFCIFASSVAFSQDYIVTLKSDTLRGEVKLLSYDLLDRVQLSQNKKKSTLTALQVRTVFIKGELFAPVKLENTIRMMKIIRGGFLSLYAYRAPGQAGFDTRILQRLGQKSFEVPNIGFKKIVGDLVEDCTSVYEQVKSGNFDRGNVEELVDQYNACIGSANEKRIADAVSATTPVAELIDQMKSKVSASDLTNKSDVNDLLTSIGDRYKKGEPVPVYMKEGLKGYLGAREDLKGDMERLFTLIDK